MVKNVYLFNNFFKKNNLLNLFNIILLVSIDIISKNYIVKYIKLYDSYYVNSYLNFTYLKNYGIIFGFFSKNYFHNILLIINIIILSIIFFFIKYKYNILSYNFIISGILGNLINRINYGFVIDFIDLHIYHYHLPIFNIADILIFIGIFILIINYYIL
ncbi:signal peptidase II [Enterobacteriaceae endosymbiont of Donacia semicuprea]|uniref:signal peptidase II n=1 Tax=Enterobacteriaceae endosymbiont of Donacia semicuprea TaxID=2675783 RepID=UPI0014495834|nr:signal peptidase II [Enterobacteriaceae endosymbiont of Donacia semicuprea]QJC32752.1 signal peptidase II [Enterobacteriaceae endosymbiont of Donacia semicuprea]